MYGGYPEFAVELARKYNLKVKMSLAFEEEPEMFEYSFSPARPRYEHALEALFAVLGDGPTKSSIRTKELFERVLKGEKLSQQTTAS